MKKILALILAAVMVFALCAAASADEAEKKVVIGVAMPQLDNDGFKANLIGINQFAEENNIELVVNDGKNTVDTQMQNIEDLITKGVDAIVMCPVDSGAMAAVVEKAVAQGIPVISFDRNVSTDALSGLAESNNTEHGAKAAELMAEVAEKAGMKVEDLVCLELLGTQSASAGLQRHQGFEAKAKELGINIVAQLATEFKNDNAFNAVLDAFQAHPDINAIFIPSDNACYNGVESALTQLGKLIPAGEEGHILMTSVDGGPNGLGGVRAGYLDAIAAQSKLLMSEKAMELALKTVLGEEIEENIIQILPTPVTPENVDDPTLWANSINTQAVK